MILSRLTLAARADALALPESGRIAVFLPRLDHDLSALPKDRVEIITGNLPDHAFFAKQGFDVATSPTGEFSGAVVFLPRAKALARAAMAEAHRISGGGPVFVDGHRTDGAESMLKAVRNLGSTVTHVYSKAHGKVFTVTGGDLREWEAPGQITVAPGFVTAPGVFSADGIDQGSALLAESLPQQLKGRVADLGAGWGYLSTEILKRDGVKECHLFEADHAALECARVNIDDGRAVFHWADVLALTSPSEFDVVVCNPPFHTHRAADVDLGRGFIEAAARLLARHGTLWLVANRHLPYETPLTEAFAEVSEVAKNASFKIFRAKRPRRSNSPKRT